MDTPVARTQSLGLAHQRDLLVNLVAREFKARYKDSVLGFAWAIVNPLAQLTIYYIVFQQVLALGMRRYSSLTFIGLIAWGWFSTSINSSINVLKNSRDMVEQPGFPPVVLPIATVTTGMIDFVVALPLLALIVLLDGGRPGATVLFLPLVMIVQFAFTLGLALLFAGINAAFRDTRHIVLLWLQLFFFLTPIFYGLEVVPAKYLPYFQLNPMVHILGAYRSVLVEGVMPDPGALLVVSILAAILIATGLRVFGWARYRFLEEL